MILILTGPVSLDLEGWMEDLEAMEEVEEMVLVLVAAIEREADLRNWAVWVDCIGSIGGIVVVEEEEEEEVDG